jgi:RHS repeat-associated protein
MVHGADLYLYHNDPNGCPTRLLDTDGNVVWAAKYDALGKVECIVVDRVDNPIRMQGQYFDSETELYYNRYRYFDPIICAFISQDPLGLVAGENVYAFAPNVQGWADPLGLSCWSSARKKYWKNIGDSEFKNPSGKYSTANINRMQKGKAPKMTVQVMNRKTGLVTTKDVSIELHHTQVPQRVGGANVHNASNLTEVTPWQHEAIDPFRNTGEDLVSVIKDVNIW